jgi:prolyl-tRNA synthetase
MNKKLLLSALLMFAVTFGFSQTKEELKTQKAEKQAEADKFQEEANAIQAQIDALPGWRVGAFGTIGGSLSNFSDWYSQGKPNNSSGNIGVTFNAFANKIEDKYFWRNALTTNFAWVKLDDKDDPADSEDFESTTDVFNISSLYGRKLSENWAASGLMEYRTTLLDNFNNPGFLDVGVGATWTPLENLIVVIHPLNYNFVFSDNDDAFKSSAGAKIVADYTRQIGAVAFKSNFSTFQSYKDGDLSNFTWTNSFSYKLWKMIGVGFDFALRSNKQEAANAQVVDLKDADNKLQSYYTVGLSYSF